MMFCMTYTRRLVMLFITQSFKNNDFNKMIKPMMQDRLINPFEGAGDAPDANIRPALLAEYIGQPVVREQMEVSVSYTHLTLPTKRIV